MIQLEWESFIFILDIELLNELSIIVGNSISIVHDFPFNLGVEPANEIIEFLPEESSGGFTSIEGPIVCLKVIPIQDVTKLDYQDISRLYWCLLQNKIDSQEDRR